VDGTLLGLTPHGDTRIEVSRGGISVGAIDRICLHRWGTYRPDGTRAGVHPTLEAALAELGSQPAHAHPQPVTG
jgi:hypothetical protein